MLAKGFWLVVSLVAACSLAVVAGVVNPAEKVNALWLVTAAACFYMVAYRFYGAFLAARVLSLDPALRTPARRLADGMDFHPTNRWVLFGHHFAAIAGAGPLIGPMLAAQFGYLPGFLWILIGSVLVGAVHDMVILGASVRRNGRSLAQIAKDEIGPVGGLAASLAILFILIVALAGLGLAVVNSLAKSPWGTFTIFLTIPIALFMGLYLYKIRPGRVGEVSAIGFVLLLAAVFAGHYIPGSHLEPYFNLSKHGLVVAMAAYGFVASILPVWMLLCPRDYLSTYMKIGTVLLLACGVIFMAPTLQMPPVTRFVSGGGPIIPGTLFPFMFITIACGAISGFHSLISSGTTPKMITSEREIPMIGYGAMLAEGFVAVMALVAATILIPGDYFAINTKLSFDAIAALGFPVERVRELSALVGTDVAGRPGGAVSLAVGMASILSSLPGMAGLMPYWYNFALMFEALFILTTVDTGTRVARFLLQELGSRVYAPLGQPRWLPGIIATSLMVVVAWSYLIWSGNVSTIWPMFGVSNQLLAAIALGIGTTVLIKGGKVRYAWTTALPMAFMYVTTFAASWQLTGSFLRKAATAPTAAEALTFRVNGALVAVMAILAVVTLGDMLHKWYGYLTATRPVATSEVLEYEEAA
ncbi:MULTISPECIES: carbon starvation CstA family protein [Geobacter]|uniref:carbon starvation CstA family protein n=1 Tax=Geobacter TaxID=28231 RepID=UPI002572D0A2|nr:carbon starvation CstA family protein [Geobacter sulfurreducens]BEH09101.1 carbon starvation CstA family protein [Geobacter sulfurreducens subsp. ethanolicus]BET56992.1 carbon starvation CstA family protein [Geobacter sp. 60473]HML77831.1 carbon starvation CstA family protein [Geobacter sulfurreducens]